MISLPGRIYEVALYLSPHTTTLKNNSLNLFWLHENSEMPSYLFGRDCSKTKTMDTKPLVFSQCFNSSIYPPTNIEECTFNALINYQKVSPGIKCLEYTLPRENKQHHVTHYMTFSNEFPKRNIKFNIKLYKLSWIEASNMCKEAGALLPYFTSRQDLDQLLRVLRLSRDGFLLEGLLIGLVYSPTSEKVNYFFLF